MDDDLLSLARKEISVLARKRILKASLRGIAELHGHIKSNNIMVNYHDTGSEMAVEQVKLRVTAHEALDHPWFSGSEIG
ncbi:hypothetical protein TESG_02714 [Trichophyton tonsurans CBS 112818]|uniref:Protein kinase domain-containing protein n=1 Tax=Trichophyton tonsurans (strain CBS 112818) TaxID=647933 RepID=F2RV74_TRIT1|nr:hypothetical protein TESG_02714 [Trichophyton tonsurans CBS 112818]